MAGKLCGPSSSKASPATTPIPLGTAKHKILKTNETQIKKKNNSHVHTNIHTYIRTRTRHTHTYTHIYALHEVTRNRRSTEISRAKKNARLLKHTGTKEWQGKKRVNTRVHIEARGREKN